MTTENKCGCINCSVVELFPPNDNPDDRIPSIVGIDVSTKYIALGVVPAMGALEDVGGFGFNLVTNGGPERCAEAAVNALAVIDAMQDSIDITSIAIEMPRGFGGKIIPIVGAISGIFGSGNVEWYAPTQWQSVIRSQYGVTKEDTTTHGVKNAIHRAVAEHVPHGDAFLQMNEDLRDALCIAMAHRIETLKTVEFSDYDLKWLEDLS